MARFVVASVAVQAAFGVIKRLSKILSPATQTGKLKIGSILPGRIPDCLVEGVEGLFVTSCILSASPRL
jgi:hypothetical protein